MGIAGLWQWMWSTRPLEVELTDLAPLWLRYNQRFTPIPVPNVVPLEDSPSLENNSADVATKEVSTLRSAVLEPYRDMLERQQAWDGVVKLVEMLDVHGGCPSLVLDHLGVDEESQDLFSFRQILGAVTLRDHTERMTRLVLEECRRVYRDFEPLIPKALVVGLGHDLGKIPVFRKSGLYSKQDHPEISAMKVREVFGEQPPFWLEDALTAIRSHHKYSGRDPFCDLVKRADARAREEEIVAGTKDFRVVPFEEWFHPEELLARIRPQVNVLDRGSKCLAFSYQDVLYCDPDSIFLMVMAMAKDAKVLDLRFSRKTDQEAVLCQVTGQLKNAGLLARDVGDGFYGRRFTITALQGTKAKSMPFHLLPLKLSALGGQPSEFEVRKTGWLQVIEKVEVTS